MRPCVCVCVRATHTARRSECARNIKWRRVRIEFPPGPDRSPDFEKPCYRGLFHVCYMCSSSISYMLTAVCCGCIGSSKSQYSLCRSSSSLAIPPRPKTLTLSCILPCQSLREMSRQKYVYVYTHTICQCKKLYLVTKSLQLLIPFKLHFCINLLCISM